MSEKPKSGQRSRQPKMSQRTVIISRIAGVIGIVAAFIAFSQFKVQPYSLVITVTGIIALVAPDVVDQLPFGPRKPPK